MKKLLIIVFAISLICIITASGSDRPPGWGTERIGDNQEDTPWEETTGCDEPHNYDGLISNSYHQQRHEQDSFIELTDIWVAIISNCPNIILNQK